MRHSFILKNITMRSKSTQYIFGKNPVLEALHTRPEIIRRLYVDPGKQGEVRGHTTLPIHPFDYKHPPEGLAKDAVHQGFAAEVDGAKLLIPLKSFLADLQVTSRTVLTILGEVQDPHNVGAIIRSAAAFGVAGVLIPPHRQAGVTGTVIKASAGMAFTVPLVEISNVNSTIETLKKNDFWVYGLDSGGEVQLDAERFDRPSVFVIGNEGEGLRQKTREACDAIVSIPMDNRCESLNASTAAAVAFYARYTQR